MGEARAGDAAAASALPLLRASFLAHSDALVRLAGVLTRDRAAAEDIVQEAFVRLHGARLRDPDAVLPYLRRTVLNLCRHRGRRLSLAARHNHREPAPTAVEGADAAALRLLDRRTVLDAIARLPARQRECVVLRFYEGLSESEVAALLGVSRNSVKKHIQRATALLAERLEASR